MNPNDLETWADLLAPTPRGYFMADKLPYHPITMQDPTTQLTHVANQYYLATNQTLCGLDAGDWVGWSKRTPTCPTCAAAIKEIDPAYDAIGLRLTKEQA